jgi:hypothetical protein
MLQCEGSPFQAIQFSARGCFLCARALWGACEEKSRSNGGECRLFRQNVASLQSLEDAHGPYTAVIVAAGAAAGVLPEIGALLPSLVLMTLTVRFQDSVGHYR